MSKLFENFNAFAPGQTSLMESFNGFADLNESKGNPIYLRGEAGFEDYDTPKMFEREIRLAVARCDSYIKKCLKDKKIFESDLKKLSKDINKFCLNIEEQGFPTINYHDYQEVGKDILIEDTNSSMFSSSYPEIKFSDDTSINGFFLEIEKVYNISEEPAVLEAFVDDVLDKYDKEKICLTFVDDSIQVSLHDDKLGDIADDVFSKCVVIDSNSLLSSQQRAIEHSKYLKYLKCIKTSDGDSEYIIPVFNFVRKECVVEFKRIFGVTVSLLNTPLQFTVFPY